MTAGIDYHAERSWHFLELVDDEESGASWKKPATNCGAPLLMPSKRLLRDADGPTGRTVICRKL